METAAARKAGSASGDLAGQPAGGKPAGPNGYGGGPERPPPMTTNPLRLIATDLAAEWRGRGRYPPGLTDFSVKRANLMLRDPLPLLLDCYERFGPVFSLRVFHSREVVMLGPEANHFVLVSGRENLHWRQGSFRELVLLMGDGLLTIDGGYHDHARATMLPAFHAERLTRMVEAMSAEADAALDTWAPGETIDVYGWMRNLAMRIAMRALLGLDPDHAGSGAAAAHHFERALGIYGEGIPGRLLRGPGTAHRRTVQSRRVLDEIIYSEIDRRRANPDPDRYDVLSLLLDTSDEDGRGLADDEIRDQVMTLMFAGHDTATSTLSFLMYELARNPQPLERLRSEQDEVLEGAAPDFMGLEKKLPYLAMVMDETLRLYPPAWIGPRRAVRDFEFAGRTVPEGALVNYCSWASHRIPEVFPEPDRFLPERFEREAKAALPHGAYVPFGGGPRICIGKRFGQSEVKLVGTRILQRFRLELPDEYELTIRQMPTLSPEGGLPMTVRER